MTEFPIVNMDGEVLASDEAERVEVMHLLAAESIDIARQLTRLQEINRNLEALMQVGDSVAHAGYAVSCEMGPRPARAVNRQEVLVHAEALAEFGLAPREETSVRVVYPGVSQVLKAKADLARAGINVNTLLLDGGETRPVVKVYAPKVET